MAAKTVINQASADEPEQQRQVRDGLEQPVSFGKIFMRQELGQDPVLRGDEQSSLNADQEKDRHRRPAAGRVKIERGRTREHERQFNHLHGDDDRSLAHTVGQHARRKREQRQRKHERDLGERCLLDLGGFLDHRGHRQQGDDLLERLIVELAEGLGHEQAVQLSPDAGISCGFMRLFRISVHIRCPQATTESRVVAHARLAKPIIVLDLSWRFRQSLSHRPVILAGRTPGPGGECSFQEGCD
jgi:hypothetical protein